VSRDARDANFSALKTLRIAIRFAFVRDEGSIDVIVVGRLVKIGRLGLSVPARRSGGEGVITGFAGIRVTSVG
jgi:hypothetical protein